MLFHAVPNFIRHANLLPSIPCGRTDDGILDTKTPDDNASAGEILHIDVEQVASGGIKGTVEKRVTDWKYRSHSDWLFGDLQGRSRVTTIAALLKEAQEKGGVEEADAKFLAEGWLPETMEGDIVESFVDNDGKGWTGW